MTGLPALTRRQRIVRLLSTYRDVVAPRTSDLGVSAEHGDRILLMPPAYHEGSYRELERCLLRLRVRFPRLDWQVRARYFESEQKTRALARRSGGWVGLGENERIVGTPVQTLYGKGNYRAFVESWDPHVDPVRVARGVDLIEKWWRGDPQLPREIWEAIAA